jgi:hypothetical protein
MKTMFLFLMSIPLTLIAGGDLPLSIFKTIGTQNVEEGKDIALDSNGLIYVLSSTNAAFSSHTDVVLTCMDSELNCIWSNVYGTPAIEQPTAIAINSSDEIFICGTQLHADSDGYDVFIMSIALDGALIDYTSHDAPSWQVALKMDLLEETPLILIEDFSNVNRYRLLHYSSLDEFNYIETGNALVGRIPSAIEVLGQDIYVASYLENTANETSFQNESQVVKLNSATLSTSNLSVADSQGNVIVNDISFDSQGSMHLAGEIDLVDYVNGYYTKYDNEGNQVVVASSVVADDDFGYASVHISQDYVVLPGYLKFAGAGKKDAFVMILNLDGIFVGAPTFGGEEDDFFVNSSFTSTGELYCVGTGFSYNGGTGETIFLKLTEVTFGEYQQVLDINNDCLIVSTGEVDPLKNEIERIEYFDLMGRKCEPTGTFNQIYLQVTHFTNGEILVEKRLY